MIDYGLLVSMIIAFGVPSFVASWWTVSGRDGPVGFFDVAMGPAFVGLVVGRLVTLAFDDPGSIGSISDMLVIRSGVEFWAGLVAALLAVMVSAHLWLVSPTKRVAELAPLAMLGYAGYEAACIFRDGCFGPASPIGLRPPGLSTMMLPVGWLMAAVVAVAAMGVRSLLVRGQPARVVALAAVAGIASVRAVGSISLPHVGDGLTRQHLTSIAVAAASLVGLVVVAVMASRRRAVGSSA